MDIWNRVRYGISLGFLHGSLFLRCGLFSKVYEYPTTLGNQPSDPHDGENTKLSPDSRSNLTNRLVPRCRAPFHLGCTGQGGMMGRVGHSSIRYAGYAARTHLRPSLHCTALRCTHCMKEKSIRGRISLPAVSANISVSSLPSARYHALRVRLID